ncbi:MAG TPA: SH3 domain-containing protein [Candidatus Binatia bacterium]|nr:SH3 domain-containing protein [Candidatus Binatia bacterium]
MIRSKWLRLLTIGAFLLAANALIALSLEAAAVSGTYITTADVSLRSGPGVSYPVVTTLPKGIKINVVGRQGYWLKVESKHGDAPGYIDEQFAAPEGSTETSTTKPPQLTGAYRTLVDVDLRQGPGAKYPFVARLPSGIKVNVVRAEGDWLRVESKHGGKPGYLERRFVERWTEN